MPRVIIDNQAVEVVPGSNLLAAGRKLGLDIPALCYHPACEPNTSCLACLVKVKDPDRLVPSCATLAEDGMIVESETEDIRALRRTALELLLSDHAGECLEDDVAAAGAAALEQCSGVGAMPEPGAAPKRSAGMSPSDADRPPTDETCAKRHICRLRKYAEMYGADKSRFRGVRRDVQPRSEHPEVVYDPGKCILCGICIQVAQQAGEPLGLTFVGRGFDVRVDVPLDGSLADALRAAARRCAGACPTGALALRSRPSGP